MALPPGQNYNYLIILGEILVALKEHVLQQCYGPTMVAECQGPVTSLIFAILVVPPLMHLKTEMKDLIGCY